MISETLPKIKTSTGPLKGAVNVEGVSMVFNESSKKRSRPRSEPVHVLDSVNFQIKPGEFACLLGPSGCGKSTLLNIIAGFIKPTAG